MTKAKGRHRIEGRVKEVSSALDPTGDDITSSSEDDGLDEFDEQEYVIALGSDGQDRAVLRQVFDERDSLVDFALTQEIRLDGRWFPVLRVDCSHGTVHIDRFRKGRMKPIRKQLVGDSSDLDAAYDMACERIYDHWHENRRGYVGG